MDHPRAATASHLCATGGSDGGSDSLIVLNASNSDCTSVFKNVIYASAGGFTINNGLLVVGSTPGGAASQLGLGTTTGFGNGTAGTTVTTTTKSTGSGPATPQKVVNYLKVTVGGTAYWIPLVQ